MGIRGAMLNVATSAIAQTARLGGSGSGLGAMQSMGEAYQRTNPRFKLTVVSNLGSTGGLKALSADAIELLVMSRPLESSEQTQGFTAVEYGCTPLVFATSDKSVSSLTRAQLVGMYSGQVAHRPDGSPVRLVLRLSNAIDTQLLAKFAPGMSGAVHAAHARPGGRQRHLPVHEVDVHRHE